MFNKICKFRKLNIVHKNAFSNTSCSANSPECDALMEGALREDHLPYERRAKIRLLNVHCSTPGSGNVLKPEEKKNCKQFLKNQLFKGLYKPPKLRY